MDRTEHLQWSKERALEYVDLGDLSGAVASMVSDLGKHKETEAVLQPMSMIGMMFVMDNDTSGVRGWINGFT